MFRVGQKVVCIKNISDIDLTFSIKEGDTFTLLGIKECRCKSLFLDIGFKLNKNKYNSCSCYDCLTNLSQTILFAYSQYFRPLETFGDLVLKEIEEKINKEQEMFITI